MSDFTPEQMVGMMMTFITDLDTAEKALNDALHKEAREHRTFTTQQAAAWETVEGPNREYRVAMVEDMVKEQRFTYETAQANSKVAFQKMLNQRQKLSALQSAARAITEEIGFSRMGPEPSGLTSERIGM